MRIRGLCITQALVQKLIFCRLGEIVLFHTNSPAVRVKSFIYTFVWQWVATSSVAFVHFHEKFTNCGKFVFPPSLPPSLFAVEFQEANPESKTIVAHSCSKYFVTALMEKNLSCLENVNLESCSLVEQSDQCLQLD